MAESPQRRGEKVAVTAPQRERYEAPRTTVRTDRRKKADTDSGLTPEQRKAALETETKIRNRKTETARAITDDGRVVDITVGRGSSDRAHIDVRLVPQNAVLTHNHPSGYDQPVYSNGVRIGVMGGGSGMGARIVTSLSGDDIRLALRTNAKEVRAVSPTYTYSLRRPAGGWGNVTPEQIQREWYEEARRFQNENQSYARSGREQLGRFNAVLSHAVTRKLANKYGWTYTRRKA